MLTEAQLAAAVQCSASRAAQWLPHIDRAMQRFGISTKLRAALFLAQLGHESQGLSRTVECLNYSSARLLEIFPSHFTRDAAARYARQPERIANRVYAGRNGNGGEASGDGWRYRGRCPIQLTGRGQYAAMAELLDVDLLADPDRALELPIGADIAAAWWRTNGLNSLADAGDVLSVSRRINLGTTHTQRMPNGFADRVDRTKRARVALGVA